MIFKKFIYFILFLQFGFLSKVVFSQTTVKNIVSGVIYDQNKNPLEGVKVEHQSSKLVVFTSVDGRFSIEARTSDNISFQKAGYETVKIKASNLQIEGIVMAYVKGSEKEIINIPFAARPRRQVNAAVSVLKGEDLSQIPFASLTNILIGRLPGVYVTQLQTAPGYDNASILIRGRSSYNDQQGPLVLVDGIERDLSDMDASEIESISILKDAASLSWYGVRGANGVLLVTTRHGTISKTKVTFEALAGVQHAESYTRPLDSYTYASLYNESLQNSGLSPLYNQTALDAYRSGSDKYTYPNNNLVDRFLTKSASVQRYVATISGGNASVRYFTSFSHYNQGGLFAETKTANYNSNPRYHRYNFRSNIDATVTKNLDVSLYMGGRVENRLEPGQNMNYQGIADLLNSIYATPPNAYPLVNEDGTYGGTTIFRSNPLAQLQTAGYNLQSTRVLLASTNARYKLDNVIKGLSAGILYSFDMSGIYTSGRTENFEVYQRNANGAYSRFGNKANLAFRAASFSNTYRNNELWAGLSYQRSLGVHDLDVDVRYNAASMFNPQPNARFDFNRKGISSRVSYSYQQRYFAEALLTYSGNQRFAPRHRYAFFPALALGWVASEESFIKNIKAINYLKLRSSFGVAGSESLFGARLYSWENLYSTRDINGNALPSYSFGTGFSSAGGASGEVALPNPNLTFEKSRKLNAGFEARFLDHSLSVTADYFIDKRTGIISPSFLPGIIGQALVAENSGEAQYKGFETGVNYTLKINKADVSLFGNFTHVKTNLSQFNDQPGLPKNQLQSGHPLANLGLMYEAVGIFQNENEISNSPRQTLSGVVKPGDINYRDINKDGLIDNFDRSIFDYSTLPENYYSFGTTIKYTGFYLSAIFIGQQGGNIDIRDIVNSGNANNGFLNQYSVDRWTPSTANTSLWPRLTLSDRGNNTAPSTFWVRSTDYLQLRNLEVGYSFTGKWISKLKIEECRFYVSGYNLATFGKLNELDINPALPTAGRNGNYPYLKTFSSGVSIKF